jgi:hypothetical protein
LTDSLKIDFDLLQEFGIKIEPTAVFMGSILSNEEKGVVKNNCKVGRKIGDFCGLVTGPGAILAIRHTINIDTNGRPLLEQFSLENGGNCIDENGTWLIDVPMNLDYVYTSESGERLISADPNIGIPTKGRYRFKVKWGQNLVTNGISRGVFLVPNIKEWGWINPDDDPSVETPGTFFNELLSQDCQPIDANLLIDNEYLQVKASYAFSLDWEDYGGGTISNIMINEAVRCEDRFFEMSHSKVYTISQLITEHRGGGDKLKYIAIKDILNDKCESTYNTFPANDGQLKVDVIYELLAFLIGLFVPILITATTTLHLIIFVICVLALIVKFLKLLVCKLKDFFCWIANLGISILGVTIRPFYIFVQPICWFFREVLCNPLEDIYNKLNDKCKNVVLNIPMYTYDDCQFCDCGEYGGEGDPVDLEGIGLGEFEETLSSGGASAMGTNFFSSGEWTCGGSGGYSNYFGLLMTGEFINLDEPGQARYLTPRQVSFEDGDINVTMFTTSLTYPERINLLNTKAKYFEETVVGGSNPGGSWNRIKVTFNTDMNDSSSKFHLDNVLIMMVKPTTSVDFSVGDMLSTVQLRYSRDPNINLTGLTAETQFNNLSTTGTTRGTSVLDPDGNVMYYQQSYPVYYANPNGNGSNLGPVDYILTATTGNTQETVGQDFYKFPSDLEYFQVIHNLTVDEFLTQSNPAASFNGGTFRERVLTTGVRGVYTQQFGPNYGIEAGLINGFGSDIDINCDFLNCLEGARDQKIIIMVRGVDPYSTRTKCRYDLNRIFGNTFGTNSSLIVEGDFKLNIPIQGGIKNVRHTMSDNDTVDLYSNTQLFYPSYNFMPDPVMYSAYTTSAVSYYCKYDTTDIGVMNPYSTYVTNSSLGLRVSTNNYYTREPYVYTNLLRQQLITPGIVYNYYLSLNFEPYIYTIPPDPDTIGPIYNTSSNGRNRGYFYDEIIEGGGVMTMNASNKVLDSIFNPAFLPIFGAPSGYLNETSDTFYFSEKYTNSNINMLDSERIIMRGDRLPTSSSNIPNGSLVYPMQTNPAFSFFLVDEDGYTDQDSISITELTEESQESIEQIANNPTLSAATNTFTCQGLVPLRCYQYDADGMLVLPPTSDDCYTNRVTVLGATIGNGEKILRNGCYKLVTQPIISLPLDIYLIMEWAARVKINFAACRNVFGHVFTNHWVNGTLFMFPLKSQTKYTSPSDQPPNAPWTCACSQLVFVNYDTNQLYYRSSPYNPSVGFIGRDNGYIKDDEPNIKNLEFPTTMIDLGPRTYYTTELINSDFYQGYIINRMDSTSFQDTSDLLNQFILSRLIGQSIIGLIFSQFVGMVTSPAGGAAAGVITDPVKRMFGRPHQKIDGDYAQMVAINSQLGVEGYDPDEYLVTNLITPPLAPASYVFINPSKVRFNVFGIFYQSNTQLRDWISPHRLISNPNGLTGNDCTYENYPIFTQVVPFYQWEIKENRDEDNPGLPSDSIFGDQKNDWYTNPSGSFFQSGYQNMDRLNSDYMQPVDGSVYNFHKGYIYNVVGGTIDPQPPQAGGPDRVINPSGPYYFYFGLLRGRSAFDRFLTKWVKNDINDF